MRIAEYKQIDTKSVTNVVIVYDYNDDGEIIGQHEETVTKEIPVMGMVYRDATPEEIEAMERDAENAPAPEPTTEDRVAELEAQNEMLTECILELSELLYN